MTENRERDDARPELNRPPKCRRLHWVSADSERLRSLREEPRTGDEFYSGGAEPGTASRDMIFSLSAPTTASPSSGMGNGKWTPVFYLYGDERRAIRRAIHENETYIDKTFDTEKGASSLFAHNWPDQLYQLLCEEWEFYRRHGGDE